MNRVFIGFDHRQPISYTVLQHSIYTRTDTPVSITPLCLNQLPLEREGLTPFTWSRFLVPWLCEFKGWALFLDIDMLVQGDINELFELADENYAVMVSQNKLRFEWASAILFNCGHRDNAILTPQYIETASGLHGMDWTENVGEFPGEWNHLVGYDEPRENPKLIHYTQGIPIFPETMDGGYLGVYEAEAKSAMSSQSWRELMGNSVHAKPVVERLVAQGKAKLHRDADGRATLEMLAAE